MITKAMYLRGKQFFLAAYLLYEKIGKEYAFLHLLCQGLEITLKSALLYKDYDKNKIQLSKPLGHNLDKILKLYLLEYGIKRIDKRISSEIIELNSFYKTHRMRYASTVDILIDPKTIKTTWSIKLIARLVKSFDKEFDIPRKTDH